MVRLLDRNKRIQDWAAFSGGALALQERPAEIRGNEIGIVCLVLQFEVAAPLPAGNFRGPFGEKNIILYREAMVSPPPPSPRLLPFVVAVFLLLLKSDSRLV